MMSKNSTSRYIGIIIFFIVSILTIININRYKNVNRINQNRIPPDKYFQQMWYLTKDPFDGVPHPERLIEVQKELEANVTCRSTPGEDENIWQERGPNNVGGRTRAIMFDPNDNTNKRVFAGGISGGLWVNDDISDKDSEWSLVNIPENLAVSCITYDPNNTDVFYLGTGESHVSGDANGNGVWKSTDAGSSWIHILGGSSGNPYVENGNLVVPGIFLINDIKVRDIGSGNSEIFVAVGETIYGSGNISDIVFLSKNEYGLYKSSNAGDDWNRIPLPTSPFGYRLVPNNIEITSDNKIWVSTKSFSIGDGGGEILSSNDGDNFIVRKTISNGGRTELEVSKTDPNKLFVFVQKSGANPIEILRTDDAFTTSTSIALPKDLDPGIPDEDFARGQSSYNLTIAINPKNDNMLYVGGIDLFKTANSNEPDGNLVKWNQLTHWFGGYGLQEVHADQHAVAFSHDSNTLMFGNDGGVYYSDNGGINIHRRNKNYNTIQIYSAAINQDSSNEKLLAGSQDNGIVFINSATKGINSAREVITGDGGYVFIDKDGEYMIASGTTNIYYYLNYNTGAFEYNIAQSGDNGGFFINPAGLDSEHDILYTNGTIGNDIKIYRYKLGKTSASGSVLKNSLLTAAPTAFTIPDYNTNTLFVGTTDGKVLKLANATTIPVWSDISGADFVGSISDIALGKSENEIYVTFYNYGVNSIFYTNDGGNTWINKEGDLPDIPVRCILPNPINTEEVILGTDLGVWATKNFSDTNPDWHQSQNGMKNVVVTGFDIRTSDNTVLASTYGRGLFTATFASDISSSTVTLFNRPKPFEIYPTISKGDFFLELSNDSVKRGKLIIYTDTGKRVFEENIDFSLSKKQAVSVQLPIGLYFAKIYCENRVFGAQKIIID